MLAELEWIFDLVALLEVSIVAVHFEGDGEVAAGEEAPDGEDQLENSHHAPRLLERIEFVRRPEIVQIELNEGTARSVAGKLT